MSPGDEDSLVADANHTHGHQRERGFFGQFFALERGVLNSRGAHARHPFIFVAEPRRPLVRRDNRAIGGGQLDEVEALRDGLGARLLKVRGVVLFEGHALQDLGGGDALGSPHHFLLAALVLAPELRHQRCGSLAVEALEGGARGRLDDEAIDGDGHEHGRRRRGKELGAEGHGASQTESSFIPPHRDGAQPRTRGPNP